MNIWKTSKFEFAQSYEQYIYAEKDPIYLGRIDTLGNTAAVYLLHWNCLKQLSSNYSMNSDFFPVNNSAHQIHTRQLCMYNNLPINLNQSSGWSSVENFSAIFLPTLMIPSRSLSDTGECLPMRDSSYTLLNSLKNKIIALMM